MILFHSNCNCRGIPIFTPISAQIPYIAENIPLSQSELYQIGSRSVVISTFFSKGLVVKIPPWNQCCPLGNNRGAGFIYHLYITYIILLYIYTTYIYIYIYIIIHHLYILIFIYPLCLGWEPSVQNEHQWAKPTLLNHMMVQKIRSVQPPHSQCSLTSGLPTLLFIMVQNPMENPISHYRERPWGERPWSDLWKSRPAHLHVLARPRDTPASVLDSILDRWFNDIPTRIIILLRWIYV